MQGDQRRRAGMLGATEDFPTRPSILHRDPRQDGPPSLTCKERILGALVAPRLGSTDRGRLWRSHRSPPVRAQSGNLGWVPKAPGPKGTCRTPQEGASGSSSLNDKRPLSKSNKTRLLLPCPLFLRAEGPGWNGHTTVLTAPSKHEAGKETRPLCPSSVTRVCLTLHLDLCNSQAAARVRL